MKILNLQQIRESEQEAVKNGVSYDTLMLRAGTAAAEYIDRKFSVANKKIVVVCGNGNNGGDGFVIAKLLEKEGAFVKIMLPLGEPKTETARNQFKMPWNITTTEKIDSNCDIIIDALFGIGLDRPIAPGRIADLVKEINSSSAYKIAIDIPSGVYCDGGVEGEAVKAQLTLTMIAAKPCFFLPPSNAYYGKLKVLDIGTPVNEYSYSTVKEPRFKKYGKNAHKGSCGSALMLCGSYGMCGAHILAAKASLRAGLGLLKTFVCDKNYGAFCTSLPEAVTIPVPTLQSGAPDVNEHLFLEKAEEADAVLIGCGLGKSEAMKELIYDVLPKIKVPVVLDADGINAVCNSIDIIKEIKVPVILTPHPGEMARLCKTTVAEIEGNRIKYARDFAKEYGCVLVLKGANTVIASPEGKILFNTTGNPGMATGGSGDVLAGITVSLLAQGETALDAAAKSVYLHGVAGDRAADIRGQRGMLPTDIIDELIVPED